ncbi:DUF4232 domain-containing protein [Streptomyces sp. RPA4-5]|uniref:DUF4232 domain-containing protein n=1 Tax=Streptomyces TaxID=1883 RepID=UPI00143EA00A|nr:MULTISPECIES: DUF4232 domain-containing protein [Streptomyces]MCX4638772.1 DUF4232 domain-containing protein [Streptomyces platensis]QIY59143.1 DUF4232 domain-containing protein [Streptomyces sp. RPA4-5]WJY42356.1 DUF4232 domain-containing protein [Streptomyces sp. P9-2B-2]
MSLTIKTLGRGRRVAAGSLIAVAALALTACEGGPDAASRPSSAAAPASSHHKESGGSSSSHGSAESSGAKAQSSPGGQRPSAKAATPGGKPTAKAPSAAEAHTSAEATSDRCTAANMSLRLGAADAGAGNIRYPLVFTNKGTKACSLRGFPGVSLINRDGSPVGKPATRDGGAGGVVRLQPGQSAHALLHTLNEGVSDTPCWGKSQIVYVYPPGSKESMTTGSRGLRVCGGRFEVTAVEAGALG